MTAMNASSMSKSMSSNSHTSHRNRAMAKCIDRSVVASTKKVRKMISSSATTSTADAAFTDGNNDEVDGNGEKKKAIVFGATGGVGQLCVASLVANDRYEKVYAFCRTRKSGEEKLRESNDSSTNEKKKLRIVQCDLRDSSDIENAMKKSGLVDVVGDSSIDVICCLGTTAFPSQRWKENNGPEETDDIATKNVIKTCGTLLKLKLRRFVLISSVGTTRTDKMPYVILNLFGVLKYKRKSEQFLESRESNVNEYTIIRPGRLTDGPYTSYDLNTLLKATSSEERRVEIKKGDSFDPQETSRIAVAECAVQSLQSNECANKSFVIGTSEGFGGPKTDPNQWLSIFKNAAL